MEGGNRRSAQYEIGGVPQGHMGPPDGSREDHSLLDALELKPTQVVERKSEKSRGTSDLGPHA